MSNKQILLANICAAVQDGLVNWEYLAISALKYMSETDIKHMLETNEIIIEEEVIDEY